jgi:DNA (cytosine-5)-methyltransferase 1
MSQSCDPKPSKPTVISTFAGCGGSSLGYQMAGYDERLAVEWDQHAIDVFKLNFPDVPVYAGDIGKLSLDEVYSLSGLESGELDVFDGSPPCQGFSTSGKRRYEDNRNQLSQEYCRLLEGLSPKCFVMENVSGMVKGKMKLIFVEILKALKNCGYQVKAKLMNAAYYGVPQMRQRMIFIGCKDKEPTFPKPQQRTILKGRLDAIPDHICFDRPFTDYMLGNIKKIPQGKNGNVIRKNYLWSKCRLDWNKPANTITKTVNLVHPDEHRHLSIGEAMRVQSLPDDFRFIGGFSEQWARIGNSVPPLLMKAVATHIKDELL